MEELTKEQIRFLNYTCRGPWEQTEKGIVVYGDVNMFSQLLKKIPVKFYKVSGYFDCSYNELESLENRPKHIGSGFYCNNNKLKSLEGIEEVEVIKGKIYCFGNKINYKKEKELRPEIYKKIELSTLQRMIVES